MPENDARALKGKTGLTRLINATKYSRDGIARAWKTEEAFRQELILAVILTPVAFVLPVSLPLRLLCILSIAFVLVTELLNSAVEAAIDRIGPEIHPLSKFAKDAGSAAVLISLTAAAIVWAGTLFSLLG